MKPSDFNKLLFNQRTSANSLITLTEYYYPKILIRLNKLYGDSDLSVDVGREFFVRLVGMKIKKHIKYPNLWVHSICDDIIQNKYCISRLKEKVGTEKSEIEQLIKQLYGNCHESINKLDPKIRQIYFLYFLLRYSFDEIAIEMNTRTSIIKDKFTQSLDFMVKDLKTDGLENKTTKQ